MRRVIIESPYAGDIERNVAYAKRAVLDSLARDEAPIASHLLFTQSGILQEAVRSERDLGIAAGHAWFPVAQAIIMYTDYGLSTGMRMAEILARKAGIPLEYRRIGENL